MSRPAATELVVVIGAGSIGQAIARRVGAGRTILLADLNEDTAAAAADSLQTVGFTTATARVDVASAESVEALVDTAWWCTCEHPENLAGPVEWGGPGR